MFVDMMRQLCQTVLLIAHMCFDNHIYMRDGGRDGGRKEGSERVREEGRKRGRDGGREGKV